MLLLMQLHLVHNRHFMMRRSISCIGRWILLAFLACIPAMGYSQERLQQQLKQVTDSLEGTVGVCVMGLDFTDTVLLNDDTHYPMQSVYKFPLALAVLDKVDRKELTLQQRVRFKKSELMQETWSPMLRECREGDNELTVAQLLLYSVSKSDNNACDLLFKLVGGVSVVDRYCKKVGVMQIKVAATEQQMTKGWDVQYTNWCTPSAMAGLLGKFYEGKLLKKASNDYLMKLMVESENSDNRLKGMLPQTAVVAHKTGTSNTNVSGVRAATNDVGIVTLPNGKHYAIVVYLKDYKASMAHGERTIARISQIVWNYYSSLQMAEGVAMKEMRFVDPARNRQIDVMVYEPTSKKKRGVAVMSPGYEPGGEGTHRGYAHIAQMLASNGYLVMCIRQDLPTDAPIPREGNLQVLRRPFWETGVKNINYVLEELERRYKGYNFKRLTVIGHSNGGDIGAMFATEYTERVSHLVTLDNRRYALPRTSNPKVLSLRSSDQPADAGVVPTEQEQKQYGIQIVWTNTIHNEMGDAGSEAQKAEINGLIGRFLGIQR